jgi:archaeosine-15-forming tRNA-guanine transglycosylase
VVEINKTDFLLTMNFILFTNQGYTLQNISLRQLHCNGGVVSIVRSSAGRLLLVYLSARRLRSSGYYPKYQNGVISSRSRAGGIKVSYRD